MESGGDGGGRLKMSFALDVRTLFYVMWPECLNSGLLIGKNLEP